MTATYATAATTANTATERLTYAESLLSPIAASMADYLNRAPQYRRALLRTARQHYTAFRKDLGYSGSAPLLTAPDAQPKMGKSVVPSYGLMMTPERHAGIAVNGRPVNMCPMASLGCAAACLNTAGKGRLTSVQRARQTRTQYLLTFPRMAGVLLAHEILSATQRHGEIRLRLNVLSDIRWERVLGGRLITRLAELGATMYDYTAWNPSQRAFLSTDADLGAYPYHLTYSRKETHGADYVRGVCEIGGTVAVVFAVPRGSDLPATYLGFPVIDGDKSDDRTLDAPGVIVGLRSKGSAIGEGSGFAVPVWDCPLCDSRRAGTPGAPDCGHIVASRI